MPNEADMVQLKRDKRIAIEFIRKSYSTSNFFFTILTACPGFLGFQRREYPEDEDLTIMVKILVLGDICMYIHRKENSRNQ